MDPHTGPYFSRMRHLAGYADMHYSAAIKMLAELTPSIAERSLRKLENSPEIRAQLWAAHGLIGRSHFEILPRIAPALLAPPAGLRKVASAIAEKLSPTCAAAVYQRGPKAAEIQGKFRSQRGCPGACRFGHVENPALLRGYDPD